MKICRRDSLRRLAVPVLFIAAGLASCTSSSQKLLEEADANWRKGRNEEALQGNQILYQREPKGTLAPRALLNTANIYYYNLRQLKPAIQFYDKLVREFPEASESVDAHRRLAEIYANELNDKDQAITQYDALLMNGNVPDRPEILFKRADMYFKKEDYDHALREMRALEESGVGDRLADQVSLEIGSIYQIQKEFDKAVEPFAKATASKYADIRHRAVLSLAETYETLFDFENAIATVRRLDHTPENDQFVSAEVERLKKKKIEVQKGGAFSFLSNAPRTKKLP
jgi:tetratricopeptide (TPR) repeat protein